MLNLKGGKNSHFICNMGTFKRGRFVDGWSFPRVSCIFPVRSWRGGCRQGWGFKAVFIRNGRDILAQSPIVFDIFRSGRLLQQQVLERAWPRRLWRDHANILGELRSIGHLEQSIEVVIEYVLFGESRGGQGHRLFIVVDVGRALGPAEVGIFGLFESEEAVLLLFGLVQLLRLATEGCWWGSGRGWGVGWCPVGAHIRAGVIVVSILEGVRGGGWGRIGGWGPQGDAGLVQVVQSGARPHQGRLGAVCEIYYFVCREYHIHSWGDGIAPMWPARLLALCPPTGFKLFSSDTLP